ncbi:MAG: hypothetical protein LBH20_06090 [Treponema sp.]|jgi:hypothetical protein|nr:hypothetical protein [Treponema sp.]
MNKQNESGAIAPLELANKIERWNYDKSVIKMRKLGEEWTEFTAKVTRELFLAREHLKKCQRRDPKAHRYSEYTWDGYCGEIGIPREVANYWISKFVPLEISSTGKDVLLIKAPVKEDTTASRALMQNRINEVLRTGNRPTDFTKEEDAELERQMKSARFREIMETYNAPVVIKSKDYFEETLRRSKDIAAFKLETHAQNQAQMAIFEHIEKFLAVFDDPEVKARAAFNIALKARRRANELAEISFQLQESAVEEGV